MNDSSTGTRYLVIEMTDDTQKKIENTLRQHNETLLNKNKELKRFIDYATHELKEPVRTITFFTAQWQRDSLSGNTQRLGEYRQFIHSASNQLIALCENLTQLSQATHTEDYQFFSCDLSTLIIDVCQRLETFIKDTGAEITIDHPLPTLMADEKQLGLALEKLMRNALTFHHPNHTPRIHIFAETRPSQSSSQTIRLHIRDNGIGIPAQHQPYIFDAFTALHSKETYPGTGLGLAIVTHIIDQHGGRVTVNAEEHQGTTFSLELPRVQPTEQQSTEQQST